MSVSEQAGTDGEPTLADMQREFPGYGYWRGAHPGCFTPAVPGGPAA